MAELSGNGSTSPFGDGAGATPSGPSTGGNNFLTNPGGNGRKGGGRDFTQEKAPPQPTGAGGLNADSIPAGGRLPFNSTSGREIKNGPGDTRKPFRLMGETPNPGPSPDPDMMGPMPVDNDFPL